MPRIAPPDSPPPDRPPRQPGNPGHPKPPPGPPAPNPPQKSALVTSLPDLSGVSFGQLRRAGPKRLAVFLRAIDAQLERPRFNLGSGPPGRVD